MTDQVIKAKQFKALHVKGDPLVLYNIWDVGGAKFGRGWCEGKRNGQLVDGGCASLSALQQPWTCP